MYKIVFSCVIFTFAFLSCSKTSNEVKLCSYKNPSKETQLINEFSIPVDTIQYKHKYQSILDELYLGLDRGRNSIDIFNLEEESYLGSITLPQDGSENSIQISDFYAHSKDSIFIFSEREYKLFIININGEVKDRRLFRNRSLESLHENEIIVGIESWIAQIYYDEYSKRLFFPVVPYEPQSADGFYNQQFILIYSLTNDEFEDLTGYYPSHYSDQFKTPTTDVGWNYIINSSADSSIYVSFSYSNEVMKINWHKNKVEKTFYVCSNYKNEFKNYDKDPNDIQETRNFVFENGIYLRPVYNKKNKRYYFPIRHDQPLKSVEGKFNLPLAASWSLIECDKNFKSLAEVKMEKGEFDFFNLHAFDEGVLVSRENNDTDEDYLKFHLYKIP